MAKFTVTSELSALIKIMRTQSKIAAKQLATHIDKSPSFVSKLENNEIKMIQEEDLRAILDYIVEGEDFYNDKLPAILKTLSSFQAPVNMNEQIWFLHYDSLQRPIQIPEAMLEDINARLQTLHMSPKLLAERANENQEASMSSAFPANELVNYALQDNQFLVIRIFVNEEEVAALLQKKCTVTNYFFITVLVFTLFRTEAYANDDMTVAQASQLLQDVQEYLNQHKVYSLAQLNRILSTSSLEKQQNFLSIVSTTNAETVNHIINHFRLASEHDMLLAAKELEEFEANLDWDQGFMMKLVGLPFHTLDDISFSLKKQLLGDMMALMERYRSIPKHKKNIETY